MDPTDPPQPIFTIPALPPEEAQAAALGGAATRQAVAEEEFLASDDTAEELEAKSKRREWERNEKFRDAFEIVAVCSLHLSYLALATIALVWALHLLLPLHMRWLSAEDLNHIQTLLTAGVLVGVVANHFKKRLA